MLEPTNGLIFKVQMTDVGGIIIPNYPYKLTSSCEFGKAEEHVNITPLNIMINFNECLKFKV